MFKLIIENSKYKKEIFYTRIDLCDFNHARSYLHKDIKDRLQPGFFSEVNSAKDYELFWVDDKNDIILITSWYDLYNYAAYLAPQNTKYVQLFAKPLGNRDRVEALKTMKMEQKEAIERQLIDDTD